MTSPRPTIVVSSGDMDKVYSALIIANGSLAMGMDVSLYFTFWGLQRLRRGGLDRGRLSRMHMLGLGRWMVRRRMRSAGVPSLETLLSDFKELGGRVIACEMTMEVMNMSRSDIMDGVVDEWGAVGTYVSEARGSEVTLFI